MARTPIATLFIVLFLVAQPATQSRYASLENLAAEGHKQTGAPGLSVAVVVNDRLEWSQGFGLADVENQVPVRGNTVFRIASISKPIAATAIMQLVERGRVKLDDPIQKYVPGFPPKGEYKITVRHLLTHTSGIRHYRSGEMESREPYETVVSALRIFKDDPLLFPPGTKYNYSTYGYNLVAGVVEAASGLGFEEYLRTYIWKPAGMNATYFDHVREIVPGRARQYQRAGITVRNAPLADLSNKWAGGGILSTAEDLARFHIALDEGKLLEPDSLRESYTPYRLQNGSQTGYGLGWMVSRDEAGHTWIAHSGGATGGTTYLLRDPARKLAVVVLCNVENAQGLRTLAVNIAEEAFRTLRTN